MKHSIENTCKKQEGGESKGKPRYSFYYLYVKEIVFEEKKKENRAERCYDTLFVMHIVDFNSNIRKGKPELVSYNKDKETTDLHGLFERAFNYAKGLNDGENSTFPVFLFHTDSIENIMDSYYHDINRIPYYRLIPFDNHKEMNECLEQLSSSYIDSLDLIVNILPNIIKIESQIDVELEKLSFHTYTKESKKEILKKISNQLDSILTPPTLPSK